MLKFSSLFSGSVSHAYEFDISHTFNTELCNKIRVHWMVNFGMEKLCILCDVDWHLKTLRWVSGSEMLQTVSTFLVTVYS